MTTAASWLLLKPIDPLPNPGRAEENGLVRDRGGITEEREPDGRERLTELIDELHRLAEQLMRGQPNGTLQPTALVNEAYLKLHDSEVFKNGNRTHFLATAGRAMRHILVDHARAKARIKRQAPGERVPLDAITVLFEERAVDLLALDEALEELEAFDPEMARAVELSFFGGLSLEATAEVLGIPMRTFERSWQAIRQWLRKRLE
jgi:RNA polymerase sigma factor (TIGR02999 family)